MEFLTEWKIPIGDTAKAVFDWLKANFRDEFRAIGDAVKAVIEGLTDILQEPPLALLVLVAGLVCFAIWRRASILGAALAATAVVGLAEALGAPLPRMPAGWEPLPVIALFAALAWVIQNRWQPVAIVVVGFLFIINQGHWEGTMQTLALVSIVCVICMTVGVPIGVAAAHRPRLYRALEPILDLMQTLPAPVYLIPFVVLFSIGVVPALFSSLIFVIPASIRLTHLGISSTPVALTEAARAFGATDRQLLWKVELPSAFPQIMTGLNQTIMLSLSMVVISAWVGAAGLGVPVVTALNRVRADTGFEAGAVIVALAILLDRMLRVERR